MSSLPQHEDEYAKRWDWDQDGLVCAGSYARTETGSSSFGIKPILILKVDGVERSLWVNTQSLRAKLADELERRGARDFEPGESIVVTRGATKKLSAADREYWPFKVDFPDAPRRDAASVLGAHVGTGTTEANPDWEGQEPGGDDDVPF